MQGTAGPPRRVEGSKHTDVVTAAEELLGKRLDVPVHAPPVRPGIWRHEAYAHRELRVDDRPERSMVTFPTPLLPSG